jgi:hypothetical protein
MGARPTDHPLTERLRAPQPNPAEQDPVTARLERPGYTLGKRDAPSYTPDVGAHLSPDEREVLGSLAPEA